VTLLTWVGRRQLAEADQVLASEHDEI